MARYEGFYVVVRGIKVNGSSLTNVLQQRGLFFFRITLDIVQAKLLTVISMAISLREKNTKHTRQDSHPLDPLTNRKKYQNIYFFPFSLQLVSYRIRKTKSTGNIPKVNICFFVFFCQYKHIYESKKKKNGSKLLLICSRSLDKQGH